MFLNKVGVCMILMAASAASTTSAAGAGPGMGEDAIRPDLAAYISSKNPGEAQTAAMRQFAQALQTALVVDVGDPQALQEASRGLTRAVGCIWKQFDAAQAPGIVAEIRARTVNTKERILAYERYAQALSGSVMRRASGNPCE